MIQRTIAYNEELRALGHKTIPIIVFDAEISSTQSVGEAREFLQQARKAGIRCFISFPHFERWMLIHFMPVSPHESKATIERKLQQQLEQAQMPEYKKPWDIQKFALLSERSNQAQTNCTQGNHTPLSEACLCDLVYLFQKVPGN